MESKSVIGSLLLKAYNTIHEPFECMGLNYSQAEETTASDSKEEQLLNSIVKFRDSIRENAKEDFKKILQICDEFRDEDMVDLGVSLQDRKIG